MAHNRLPTTRSTGELLRLELTDAEQYDTGSFVSALFNFDENSLCFLGMLQRILLYRLGCFLSQFVLPFLLPGPSIKLVSPHSSARS